MHPFSVVKSLFLGVLSLAFVEAVAQGRQPGEFIVRFSNDVDFNAWALKHDLVHSSALSPRARIHLFEQSAACTPAEDWAVLREIRKDAWVEAAQFNHNVEPRETIPNDPSLSQQWHHIQSGDHDIDSDLAWDITTGGQTSDGTRIVVAVLEGGGANYNHIDLIDNHWVNENEIPNNGTDDDENGFVDDYDGWHSQNGNDNIGGSGHGTSVSGMIGATGDNASGGVGVNWDVDIMQVDMGWGLSEASVIAAYNYPYEMRVQFNQSGGTRGAFVVATNASWGIDLAQPSNYPVWCGYYDTLGEAGILNCGATANAQFNIDTDGDMPTGCSSPYMVSVTATNNQDVRTFAAYGATTIDLAAPGVNVYLPSGSTNYSNTSGTSFASPCVAGAIALLYSAPCPELMAMALSDPQGAADLVRGYLLDGVDEVDNLDGETVTGGRLNSFNSLNLLMENCGPLECLPENLETQALCVYDVESDTVLTQIELGVTLSSQLCVTSELCLWNAASEWVCDSVGIANGDVYAISDLNPNEMYAVSYNVDSLELGWAIDVMTPGCDALIPGCTGTSAYNYNPEATIDDGSCDFPCVDFTFSLTLDCAPEEVSWEIVSQESGEVVASVIPGEYTESQANIEFTQCLVQDCYTFRLMDLGGNGLTPEFFWECNSEGDYAAMDSSNMVLFEMNQADFGSLVEHDFCLPAIFGCTNDAACNYEPAANMDNGTCLVPGESCDDGDDETVFDVITADGEDCLCAGVPAVYGCTEQDACNYEIEANVDDGSCYTMGTGSISGSVFPFAGSEVVYTYNGVAGSELVWSVDGGDLISGQGTTEATILWSTIDGYGVIYVLETDETGCEGEAMRTVQILDVSSVAESNNGDSYLWPNPATEFVRIFSDEAEQLNFDVVILDARGAVVSNQQSTQSVDVRSLASGHYFLVATSGQEQLKFPLIID